ncbi:MAG TPA: O-antigen ligase family protein [Candidatus Krumholzibacteria bacterium]|nr:O-antigen ligase family protein [Candidatus Krumholzibacteria bacterium]HRX52146.1 O-antigen ligase family protein [Candidatus Krumholzibacteria bacterium]
MKRLPPSLTGALGAVSLLLLARFTLLSGDTAAVIARTAVAGLALAAFITRVPLRVLVWLVPLGPVLDAALLGLGREIYLTEILVLAAAGVWGLQAARGRAAAPPPTPPVLLLAAFGAVGALALAIGHPSLLATPDGLRGLRVLWLGAVLAVMWPALDADPARLAVHWARATMLGVLVIAVGALVQFLTGDRSAEPGSFYGGSVGVAVHLAAFLPVPLAIVLGDSIKPARIAGAVAFLCGLIVLPLTASRGALGATALTTLAVLALSARKLDGGRRLAVLGLIVLVFAGGAALTLKPELAGESFAYKFRKSVQGDFLSTRTDAWAETWQAVKAHPLTGEGPEAWSPSIPLELARRHGLPAAALGLGAILAGLLAAAGAVRRQGREDQCFSRGTVAVGLAVGLGGLLLVGMAETGLGARFTPLLAAALATAGGLGVRDPERADFLAPKGPSKHR